MRLPQAAQWLAKAGKGGLFAPLRRYRPRKGAGGDASVRAAAAAGRFAETLVEDLRAGIGRQEFLPFYQPILACETGELLGFESLARWQHPKLGLLSPSLFIPIAEELGLVDELCMALLAQVCRDARVWPGHLTLSINISPVQLTDPTLSRRLLQQLLAGGIAPGRLIVELTESRRVNDLEAAREALIALRSVGIKLALDDFGAGFTNLRYLNELPFDRIKIDRSFISTLDGFTGRVIVRSIISLAQSLNMVVTAEGVETQEQADLLCGMGCDQGQGFLFGRAMPAAAVLQMIGSREESIAHAPYSEAPFSAVG